MATRRLLAVLLLGVVGLDLGNPLILRSFIDRAITAAPLDQLLGLAGLFLGVALGNHTFSMVQN